MSPSGFSPRRDSGQAAVETALTMPMMLFIIMSVLQWGMLMQARNLAQYAVYRATRAGSVNHGECRPMMHTAIATLIPSFVSFTGRVSGAGTNGTKLGNVFRAVGPSNRFDTRFTAGWASGFNQSIVWMAKERPLAFELNSLPEPLNGGEYTDWDQGLDAVPIRLEVRMVYWFPLRLPFIDWVTSRAVLAHWNLMNYNNQLPYMSVRSATGGSAWNTNPFTAFAGDYWQADILNEIVRRHNLGQYSFPISVSSRMRMMTPPRIRFFTGAEVTCGYP